MTEGEMRGSHYPDTRGADNAEFEALKLQVNENAKEVMRLQGDLSEAKRLIKAMDPNEYCYHVCPKDGPHEATCQDIKAFMKD